MLLHRRNFLLTRGVDVVRIDDNAEVMQERAEHILANHRRLTGKRVYGAGAFGDIIPPCTGPEMEVEHCRCVQFIENEDCLEEGEMTPLQKKRFAEAILIGITDGIVAYFSHSCHAGLV